jgi:6-phosphogluconolactonase
MAARFVASTINESVATRGSCRIVLSGGSTPRAAYERLAAADLSGPIDWAKVSVFFGDERMVGPEHDHSNYRMAHESLLGRVAIPAGNVHRIQGELSPVLAAESYAALVGTAPIDLVLLGMGDDGHVASLFPGGAELLTDAIALPSHAPVAPHARVTLGLGVINAARVGLLLVTGAGKATRVRDVFAERREGRAVLPAARVAPVGELHWFLDDAAALHLPLRPTSESEFELHTDQQEKR